MKVVSWNVRGSTTGSPSWAYLEEIDPDIALLQEVTKIPKAITNKYCFRMKKARKPKTQDQKFSTAILVKGEVLEEIHFSSEIDWVAKEINYYKGNILGFKVNTEDYKNLNVVSVYSPAWPIEPERIKDIDISGIKLDKNPSLWLTEILWKALQNARISNEDDWVVAGDLNSSLTFDIKWGPRSNDQVMRRMANLGFYECLKGFHNAIVPTFRAPRGGYIEDQIDHLFVTQNIKNDLQNCYVGSLDIFKRSLSDHLPIIAEFAQSKIDIAKPKTNSLFSRYIPHRLRVIKSTATGKK